MMTLPNQANKAKEVVTSERRQKRGIRNADILSAGVKSGEEWRELVFLDCGVLQDFGDYYKD